MRYFTCVLIFINCCFNLRAQTDCDPIQYKVLYGQRNHCQWIFTTLPDTLQGTILHHEMNGGCGSLANASLFIITTGKDTIRILDLCNKDTFRIGHRVTISPNATPEFPVDLPPCFTRGVRTYIDDIEIKDEDWKVPIEAVYDSSVLKTSWGDVKKNALQDSVTVTVYVTFKLKRNGKVIRVRIDSTSCHLCSETEIKSCEKEALRLLHAMKRFEMKGKPSSECRMPIEFVIEE